MRLTGEQLPLGRPGRSANPWKILTYLAAIGAALLVWRGYRQGEIRPILLPTPTPTRTAGSYAEEGQANFSAGRLSDSILAYRKAVELAPEDARLGAELARIQAYSSALLTTTGERQARLAEARASVDAALAANPDEAVTQAVWTMVYDWSASVAADETERERLMKEAEASAVRALQLDPGSALAQAYYGELLLDQGKFVQAFDLADKAASQADPFDPLSMDVHRVYGTVLEGNAQYRAAIDEYLAAAEIAPNFTYLYLLIGANYRQLAGKAGSPTDRRLLMAQALESFDRAARINEQLGVKDPTPYLSIGKTYLQDGEFFIAAINVERALAIDPANPDIFGRLGIIFFKARNYESAVDVLRCAVEGCSAAENGQLLCDLKVLACDENTDRAQVGGTVPGLPLGDTTLEYYYTYASVLTNFRGSPLFPNACARAVSLFDQLIARYPDDVIVSGPDGIATKGLALCAGAEPAPGPTPQPTAEPRMTS